MYIHGAPRLSTLSNPQAPHQPSDWPSGTFDLQPRVLPLQAPPEVGLMLPMFRLHRFPTQVLTVPSTLFFGDQADARHSVLGAL